MIETILGIIPIALREPSVISIILIIMSFSYLDRGQRNLIKEVALIKTNHGDLKENFLETKGNLNTDVAEINVSLKNVVKSQDEIKLGLRDIVNKLLK